MLPRHADVADHWTTGRLAAARAPTTGTYMRPVASSTMSVGPSARRRLTRSLKAISSLGTCQTSLVGRTATSSLLWATSMPTKTGDSAIEPPSTKLPAVYPALRDPGSVGPGNCSGLCAGWEVMAWLMHGLQGPRPHRPITSRVVRLDYAEAVSRYKATAGPVYHLHHH